MATPLPFPKEKLICGVIYHTDEDLEAVEALLVQQFGAIDHRTIPYSFSDISPYYDEELGGCGRRVFFSFAEPIEPDRLADIKLLTNSIEQSFYHDGLRPVNLDPGLINRGRLALATTKESAHRIPLSKGIYVELTLFYCRKQWNFLPWTYLDFKTEYVMREMAEIRNIYIKQRKEF